MKNGDLIWFQEFDREKVIMTLAIFITGNNDDKWGVSKIFLTNTGDILNVSTIWLKPL
jgi:hypothetical protein